MRTARRATTWLGAAAAVRARSNPPPRSSRPNLRRVRFPSAPYSCIRVPPRAGCDSRGAVCAVHAVTISLFTGSRLAGCRMEMTANALSPSTKPIILACSPTRIVTIGPGGHVGREYLVSARVGHGAFSVDSDKAALAPCMPALAPRRLQPETGHLPLGLPPGASFSGPPFSGPPFSRAPVSGLPLSLSPACHKGVSSPTAGCCAATPRTLSPL